MREATHLETRFSLQRGSSSIRKDLIVDFPATPALEVVGEVVLVADVERRQVERAQGRFGVDGGEEGRDRGGGEEEETSSGRVEELSEGLGELAVRALQSKAVRGWRSGVDRAKERLSRGKRTSFRKGGSATQISTVPLSDSGMWSGSSRSYLTKRRGSRSANRESNSSSLVSGKGFVCWNPTKAVGQHRKATRVVSSAHWERMNRARVVANRLLYLLHRVGTRLPQLPKPLHPQSRGEVRTKTGRSASLPERAGRRCPPTSSPSPPPRHPPPRSSRGGRVRQRLGLRVLGTASPAPSPRPRTSRGEPGSAGRVGEVEMRTAPRHARLESPEVGTCAGDRRVTWCRGWSRGVVMWREPSR